LASYFEVPVLSLPSPATSSVVTMLDFAQNVSALLAVSCRATSAVNAPPA
jgi:hypothetical protein